MISDLCMWAVDPFSHVQDGHHVGWLDNYDLGFHLPGWLSKFVLLQLIAAGLILLIFLPMARRVKSGQPPKGLFWNTFESLLTFVREKIARVNIGDEDCDRFVPFLWTVFLYVLFCNLLGMIPGLGSPTGSLSVTIVLMVFCAIVIHGSALKKFGLAQYMKNYVPHVGHLPYGLTPVVTFIICFIEVLGQFIKLFVLAVRLFANMFAGHLTLAVILGFIVMAKNLHWGGFGVVTLGSVILVTLISLLELFVAFLQAYVFTFLTSLFVGQSLHPHH